MRYGKSPKVFLLMIAIFGQFNDPYRDCRIECPVNYNLRHSYNAEDCTLQKQSGKTYVLVYKKPEEQGVGGQICDFSNITPRVTTSYCAYQTQATPSPLIYRPFPIITPQITESACENRGYTVTETRYINIPHTANNIIETTQESHRTSDEAVKSTQKETVVKTQTEFETKTSTETSVSTIFEQIIRTVFKTDTTTVPEYTTIEQPPKTEICTITSTVVEPSLVTVTRIDTEISTEEVPLTLYREVTTTVISERPIINYKVTTLTDVSLSYKTVDHTEVETAVSYRTRTETEEITSTRYKTLTETETTTVDRTVYSTVITTETTTETDTTTETKNDVSTVYITESSTVYLTETQSDVVTSFSTDISTVYLTETQSKVLTSFITDTSTLYHTETKSHTATAFVTTTSNLLSTIIQTVPMHSTVFETIESPSEPISSRISKEPAPRTSAFNINDILDTTEEKNVKESELKSVSSDKDISSVFMPLLERLLSKVQAPQTTIFSSAPKIETVTQKEVQTIYKQQDKRHKRRSKQITTITETIFDTEVTRKNPKTVFNTFYKYKNTKHDCHINTVAPICDDVCEDVNTVYNTVYVCKTEYSPDDIC